MRCILAAVLGVSLSNPSESFGCAVGRGKRGRWCEGGRRDVLFDLLVEVVGRCGGGFDAALALSRSALETFWFEVEVLPGRGGARLVWVGWVWGRLHARLRN